jgi:hypothetical protein
LSRAYRPAAQYAEQFTSRLTETLATHTAIVAGAVCAVLVVLSAWDEDVLQVGLMFHGFYGTSCDCCVINYFFRLFQ